MDEATERIVDETLSAADKRHIVHRGRVREWFPIVVSVVALALVGVLSAATFSAADRSSQASDRTDCRSKYSALFQQKRDQRDNLDADLNAQLGQALLNSQTGARPQAEEVARYTKTHDELDAAVKAVDALPRIDVAADHGFTLDGKSYPACPNVG